jgi:hypothetical protein
MVIHDRDHIAAHDADCVHPLLLLARQVFFVSNRLGDTNSSNQYVEVRDATAGPDVATCQAH